MTAERRGEMLFNDALLCFQSWQSCASCHPSDARVDALNWDLLNDGLGNPKNTKSLLLSHETPPAMITGIRENAEIAVRAGFRH
ncbi:MAG: cell surface protein, partial [Planctomycetota bacterium]